MFRVIKCHVYAVGEVLKFVFVAHTETLAGLMGNNPQQHSQFLPQVGIELRLACVIKILFRYGTWFHSVLASCIY